MNMMSPYLAGLLFGDGTSHLGKNGAYAVWIDQHERNSKIVLRVVKELESIGLNVHHYGFLNKKRAMVYSKAMFIEFRRMRSNPKEFFRNLKIKDKFEFFSGFFDAEGTVTDRLVVYNGELDLLDEMQRFLEKNKIHGHIYRYGKIFGIQIYKRESIARLRELTDSTKICSGKLKNVGEC